MKNKGIIISCKEPVKNKKPRLIQGFRNYMLKSTLQLQ